MKLDYGTQLSPLPITLSIGTLRKPLLREIAKLNFDTFNYYQSLVKLTPEIFYTAFKGDNGEKYWESLSQEEKDNVSLYDIILQNEELKNTYVKVFNFFFVETVIFREGYFIILRQETEEKEDITQDDIRGVISKETLSQVLELIQQICGIYNEEEVSNNTKFKNNLAKKLYEKMLKAKKEEQKNKKFDKNLTIPNIISALSNMHPTINPINVWDLTVFQLLDSFNRTQINSMYKIDSRRVSVWGDEKKTFDASLWYKNEYDKT